jgi:hypothetical protein
MRRWLAVLYGACFGLASACGGDGKEPGMDAGGATPEPTHAVVLGTGMRDFEPQPEGAHATLIAGPQGAFHVWASFLSYGYDVDVLHMDMSTGWDDTPDVRFDMQGSVVARATLDADGMSARLTYGWPARIQDPLCQDGRALRVDLTVTDEAGNAASDTRRWILDVPEQYRPLDCGLADSGMPAPKSLSR